MTGAAPKSLWSDKFRMPAIDELRAELAKPLQPVFDAARSSLCDLDNLHEVLAWQGVPWRWTLVYRGRGDLQESTNHAAASGPGRGFAYVIPDPARVQVCVPLTGALIETLPMRRFKKPVRDGVQLARSVAGVWWPTWDIASAAAWEEVLELVERKHKALLGAPEAVSA